MSDTTTLVATELEKVAQAIVTQLQQPQGYDRLSDKIISAEILASYAAYKVQEATFSKLSEQIALQGAGLQAQSNALSELKRQADLTKRQADLTKWLVVATTVLAASTAALALLTFLK